MDNLREKIPLDRGIMPACDVSAMWMLDRLVLGTCNVPGIVGYKIGMSLTERFGVPAVVKRIRQQTSLPVIWDRQKAATDIPDIGEDFALIAADSEVDGVILFPQAGPATLRAWLEACNFWPIPVIVGLRMTHKEYTQSEGGWIADGATKEAFQIAVDGGVTEFVVPGNKPEAVTDLMNFVKAKVDRPRAWSPGLISQGGDITAAGVAAGEFFVGIIGRALTELITTPRGTSVEKIEARAYQLVSQILPATA
ncbi:MAG: orotidine 5'-phosphate decarboxylase / HUMPS family protein [Patescibacteria group bacterium]